jgi:hypothetical protein
MDINVHDIISNSILGDNAWLNAPVVSHAPRLPTPGKRIKYAAKKRNQRK